MGFGFATFPGASDLGGLIRPLFALLLRRSDLGADGGGPPDVLREVRRGTAPLRPWIAGVFAMMAMLGWGGQQKVALAQSTTAAPTASGQLRSAPLPSPYLARPVGALSVGGATVVRPPLQFFPRIGLSQSFTDNAFGSPPGLRRMDTYTTLDPGFLLDFSSAHHRVSADYTLSKRWYYDNTELNDLNHQLNLFQQSELVDGLFFLESQLSIQDTTINAQGSVSADPNVTLDNNAALVLDGSVSPFFRYSYDNHANFETRYRYGRTDSLTSGVQNSESHEYSQSIASGTEFRTFQWGGTFRHIKNDFSGQAVLGPSGDRTTQEYLAVLSAEVPINRYFSVGASAGYERIEDGTLVDQPDGAIWAVGFRFRPGPRTTLQLAYGDRYDRRRVSGGLSYQISERASFELSYGTGERTTSPRGTSAFLAPDGFGNLVDVRTGQGVSFSDSIFGVSSAGFISDRFESRLAWAHKNASSSISAFHERRSGSTAQADETAMGINYAYSRSLNSYLRMAFDVGVAYVTTDAFQGTAERDDFIITGGGALDYSFTESLVGTLSYRYFDRDSNLSGNNLRENLVTAGIRKSF